MRLPFLMKPKPKIGSNPASLINMLRDRIRELEKRIVELADENRALENPPEPLVAIPVLQNRILELEEATRALQVRNTQLAGELIEARKREAGR